MYKVVIIGFLLFQTVNLADVTYYEILGISKQASAQEIRQAYKKLAVKFHPDKNPNAAEQDKFLKITEAYETLKDPDKRHNYDLYGTYPSYTRKYDHHSQAEYNKLYYNGLYHGDQFVDTLSGGSFYNYLQEGFYFVNFYSPFCPPCQNLVDHWKKLAEVYKGIVKVGAVNCKYYNSFCYNSMRIGSYPSLLFYPNGKNGNFIYYQGERTLDALDQFVMNYLRSRIHIPAITQLRGPDKPMAYVLGANRIDKDALTRVAYRLNGLVTLCTVEDDGLREKLSKDEDTTVVFRYKGTSKEVQSSEENDILKEIVESLPKIQLIEPEGLKKIRNHLRNGNETPWVLFLSSKDDDRLLLHQLSVTLSHFNFGEIDCDKWAELCISLQAETPPAWAVLKSGGAYQLLPSFADILTYVRIAASTTRLHSLSASELVRIVDGELGTWMLLVAPHQLSWEHMLDPFTRAAAHYSDSGDINFGIMACSLATDELCRGLASEPAVLVQRGRSRHLFSARLGEQQLIEFIELLRDTADMELTERQILEIMDASGRERSWLVAFVPARCGRPCDELLHEWRLVAKRLSPLPFVRVGALQCAPGAGGLCANVRAPTARLYPLASGHHYSVNLQHLSQAPYMLEWALDHIDDSVQKLTWHVFSSLIIAEEVRPSGRKPWLVYFHSPRCYRCYEMYADFAVAGILLNNAVNLGRVNCLSERSLCQHEQITSYPSLKLYLNRNQHHRFSSVISIPVKDHASILQEVKPHLKKYNEDLWVKIDDIGVRGQAFHIKHDEF